jgi:NADH-quinone oxidoreductase subunit N
MSVSNIASLQYFYPELLLSLGIIAVLLADLFLPQSRKGWLAGITGIILAGTLAATLAQYSLGEAALFTRMLALDPLAIFFKILFVISTGLVVTASTTSFRNSGEFYTLILTATLGMFLLAGATDLVMVFLAFEVLSIPSYLLAGFYKSKLTSSEASLKYILYGAFSTGLMVYGMSLLYGLTGATNLYDIHASIVAAGSSPMLFVSLVLILAGIGYKISMVPFHFWCPDVYEGAPTAVAAFFSVGPKAAGFALLTRLLIGVMSTAQIDRWLPIGDIQWPTLIAILATLSMTLGNFAALGQKNVKRLLAYSAIAHAGYILMGFAVVTAIGLQAVLLYLVIYMIMNLGAFLLVDGIGGKIGSDALEDYRGFGSRSPFVAVALTVFLVSLTGLPPTAGFIGKFYLFAALVDEQLYWLAIVGALNSVVSLFYYASIFRAMYLEKGTATGPVSLSRAHVTIAVVLVVPTVLLGIFFEPLIQWTEISLQFLALR